MKIDVKLQCYARCGQRGVWPRSQVVKRSIAALALQKIQGKSPHELAEKLGLIGSFRGRADMSEAVAAQVKKKLRAESARR